jgi:serine/threonine-protein kinase HipA
MTTVEVFIANDVTTVLVGQAHFTLGKRNVSTTFVYDAAYHTGGGMNIDPAREMRHGHR